MSYTYTLYATHFSRTAAVLTLQWNCNFHHINNSGSGCYITLLYIKIKKTLKCIICVQTLPFGKCPYQCLLVFLGHWIQKPFYINMNFHDYIFATKGIQMKLLIGCVQNLAEVSKKWLLFDSQNVLANWLHAVFDVHPKKKEKKKDTITDVNVLQDPSAIEALRNHLFVSTLLFICQ